MTPDEARELTSDFYQPHLDRCFEKIKKAASRGKPCVPVKIRIASDDEEQDADSASQLLSSKLDEMGYDTDIYYNKCAAYQYSIIVRW